MTTYSSGFSDQSPRGPKFNPNSFTFYTTLAAHGKAMSPSCEKGLAAYFEEKKPYEEELKKAAADCKEQTLQNQDPERAHEETKQPAPKETQIPQSVPNAELISIMEEFEASKLSNSKKDLEKENPRGKK